MRISLIGFLVLACIHSGCNYDEATQDLAACEASLRRAASLDAEGLLAEAESAYLDSLRTPADDPGCKRIAHTRLAFLCSRIEASSKARVCSARALEFGRNISSPAPNEALLLYQVAVLSRELGDDDGEERAWRDLIALGEAHESAASTAGPRAALGDIFVRRGKLDRAEDLYVKSIREEESLGSGKFLFIPLQKLARLYTLQARYMESAAIYERLEKEAEAIFGDRSEYLAEVFTEHAAVMDQMGREMEALRLRQRADDIRSN